MSDPVKNSALAHERYKSTKSLYDDFSKRPTGAAHLVSQEPSKIIFWISIGERGHMTATKESIVHPTNSYFFRWQSKPVAIFP